MHTNVSSALGLHGPLWRGAQAGLFPGLSLVHGVWGVSVTQPCQEGRPPAHMPLGAQPGTSGHGLMSLRWQRCPLCPAGVAGGQAGTEPRAWFPQGALGRGVNQAKPGCSSCRDMQKERGPGSERWSWSGVVMGTFGWGVTIGSICHSFPKCQSPKGATPDLLHSCNA